MNGFNWTRPFSNRSVNEKVNLFNTIIPNILSNFIPHEILTCDNKDLPQFNSIKNKGNNSRKK